MNFDQNETHGSTITTSVYTDQNGEYFFPAMADGKYEVWAQTIGFKTAKGAVDLNATKHQDFRLAAITDLEERIRQALLFFARR